MYTGHFSDYYYNRFDRSLDIADLHPANQALIIGGGTGVFALSLAKYVDDVHFTDIPREEPMFSTARTLFDYSTVDGSGVKYTAADATNLPYDSDSFDVVFALDVLEHIPDERAAISELKRVTASNGQAIVSSPIEVGPAVGIREAYRFIDGRRCKTKSLTELGLSIIGKSPLERNDHHRGYDFRQTIKWLSEEFNGTSTEYCPYPALKWLNPTVIIKSK